MKKAILIVGFIVFSLIGCATTHTSDEEIIAIMPELPKSQKDAWELMVGKWYGSQPKKDGGYLEWIVDRALDGSYLVRFRLQEQDGNVREQAEVGEWGIAGPIYFSVFKAYVRENEFVPVDPTNPYNRNAYKILELSEETFIYEEFNTKNKYTAKRVPETFDFRPK